jgi:hypothetical protein
MKPPKRLFKNRPPREVPDKFRPVVRFLVAMHREQEDVTDAAEIRAAILAYANDAFAESTAVEISMLDVDGEMMECGSTHAMAVMVFRDICDEEGLDWSDPHQQEVVFARIERALAAVLAEPPEDARAVMAQVRRGKAPRDVPAEGWFAISDLMAAFSGDAPDKIQFAVKGLVDLYRPRGKRIDPAAIREKILTHARAAFNADTKVPTQRRRFNADLEHRGVWVPCTNLLGAAVLAFREACKEEGCDWRDARQREVVYGRIERALAAVLANGS